jgi:hypothetical protein
MSPDPRPAHRSFADLPANKYCKITAKNHNIEVYPAISIIYSENPAKYPSLAKNPPKYTTAYLVQ